MIRRKHRPPKARPKEWIIVTEYEGHVKGDEFTFKDWNGLRRRGRFIEYVEAPTGHWLTCWEIDSKGQTKSGFRSIHPEQVLRWWRQKRRQPSPKVKRKIKNAS